LTFYCFMIPPPPTPTLFPYTTLFRSNPAKRNYRIRFETADFTSLCPVTEQMDFAQITVEYIPAKLCVESKSLKFYLASYRNELRSEEHTSELQSQSNLVCRLLLEKKK